jgi:carbon-monoxide dehydrogenase small subunit
MTSIKLTVNGEKFEEQIDNRLLLVDFLRDNLRLTGTHVGCTYEGVCGACTIHLDGDAVKSCMLLAVQADGHNITTVEGLSADGGLSDLQQAFNDEHGLQCGYCTPGILMNMADFLRENPNPNDEQIRHGLIGNLCRCTGYVHIVRAVKKAAKMLRDNEPEVRV